MKFDDKGYVQVADTAGLYMKRTLVQQVQGCSCTCLELQCNGRKWINKEQSLRI